MPGPNNGSSGRVCIGSYRPRPQQPTEKDKQDAIKRYVERNKRAASTHVKTPKDKIRRQLAREEDVA